MLVLGHSLGANVLLQAFKAQIEQSVLDHASAAILPPPIGNLLALINPAASAADWNEIMTLVRDRQGLGTDQKWQKGHAALFSDHQPPSVLAMTGTCPFNKDVHESEVHYWFDYVFRMVEALRDAYPVGKKANGVDDKFNRVNCDWVTSYAFPLAQIMRGERRPFGISALGQLVPESTREPHRYAGVTHGLATNTSTHVKTSFAASARDETNQCAELSGWLPIVRARSGNGTSWRAGAGYDDLTPIRRRSPKWNLRYWVTFTQGTNIYTTSNWPDYLNINTLPITAGNDPFWNVATHANTIDQHGGFVSYQLWCAMNQFVLDDVGDLYGR